MDGAWFSGVADELARCLADAERCAGACERLLESLRGSDDAGLQRRVHDAVLVPAGIARTFVDLIDEPEHVLAAARLFRETALQAVGALDPIHAREAVAALRTAAASCRALLDAAA